MADPRVAAGMALMKTSVEVKRNLDPVKTAMEIAQRNPTKALLGTDLYNQLMIGVREERHRHRAQYDRACTMLLPQFERLKSVSRVNKLRMQWEYEDDFQGQMRIIERFLYPHRYGNGGEACQGDECNEP
jgi:hypothetical protein